MKQLVALIICCTVFAGISQAKVIVVNNNTPSPSQIAQIQTAVDTASNGDTIYVQGSATGYGNVVINKRLVIFGAGYNPSKNNPLPSKLNIVLFDSVTTGANAGNSGSGTVIMGFEIAKLSYYNTNFVFANMLIKRNHFIKSSFYNFAGITLSCNNAVVEQNIFDSSAVLDFDLGSGAGCLVRNNVIGCVFRNSYAGAVLLNNVFVGQSNAFSGVSNALIANNIFYGAAPQGCSNSTFSNNLTYNTSSNTIPYGSNTGSGNILATNPSFVSATQYAFAYNQDYHLQASSAGKNAGTDATDLGLYGGGAPMPAYGGEPPIPQIKMFDVTPVVKKNTSLQIQIKAKKQD